MGKMLDKIVSGLRLNSRGQEVPDPTPVALPLGYRHPDPLALRIQKMIRQAGIAAAAEAGVESFEEANDFGVMDPEDKLFPDEDEEMAINDPHVVNGAATAEKAVKERLQKAEAEAKARREAGARAERKRAATAKPDPLEEKPEGASEDVRST